MQKIVIALLCGIIIGMIFGGCSQTSKIANAAPNPRATCVGVTCNNTSVYAAYSNGTIKEYDTNLILRGGN